MTTSKKGYILFETANFNYISPKATKFITKKAGLPSPALYMKLKFPEGNLNKFLPSKRIGG